MNRETWLNQLALKMAPRFSEMGFPLPKYRVSVGFGGNGQRSRTAAEVWHPSVSADATYEILIMPDQIGGDLVACHLAHELIHTAVGFEAGHKGNFAKLAMAIGLNRPMTATTPGPAFIEWVAPFLEELGPMPHARLNFDRGMTKPAARKPRAPKDQEELEEESPEQEEPETPRRVGESTRPKKQTARLIKIVCGECGYVARTTKTWLDTVGPLHCPAHGVMTVDGPAGDADQE